MTGFLFSRRGVALCLFLLALLPALFLHRAVFHSDRALFSDDYALAHCEYKFVQWHSLNDWHAFPLWDPTIFCGKSIVGDSLPAVLNPPQWLFWLVPPPLMFGYILWFYLALGGWGMFLFARRKGCDPWGAMLAAMVFALNGKIAGHLYAGHLEVLSCLLCLPWVVLAADAVLERPSLLRAGGLGAVLALVATCGSVQFLYLHLLFTGAYALLWLALGMRRRGLRPTLRSAAAFALGMVFFLFLAAPWWIPVVGQMQLLGARARGAGYEFASAYSPHWTDLLRLLWPFNGTVPPLWMETPKGMKLEEVIFWEETLYLGVAPLALLLPACLRPGKNRGTVVLMAVLMTGSLVLGMGSRTPFFWLAAKCVPGFALFRCPGRIFFYTGFAAGLVAGLYLSESGKERDRGGLTPVTGLLLAVSVAGALLLPQMKGTPPALAWVPVLLLALFAAAAILWRRGVMTDARWKTAVLLLAACDFFLVWHADVLAARIKDTFPESPLIRYLVQQRQDREFRILSPKTLLEQSSAAKYGLELVAGYHPGIYGRYLDLYHALWADDESGSTGLADHKPDEISNPALLDLMNTEYILAAAGDPAPRDAVPVNVPGEGDTRLYRRDSALPRVFLVPEAKVPPAGVSVLDALRTLNPRAECLVEDNPCAGGDACRSLPFERHSPSDLTVRASCEKGGVIVVSQAWHPDWRATDNGKLVKIRRVNYDFTGICVGPGDHDIRLWYWPWDFYLGCYIAAAAWAVLAVAGLGKLLRRKRPAA